MAAMNRASVRVKLRDETGAVGLQLEAMEDEGEVTIFIKHEGKQYFVCGPTDWSGKEVVVFMQRLAFYACAMGSDDDISAPIPFEAMGAHRAAARFPSVVKVASGGLHAAQSIMKEQPPVNNAGKHWLANAQLERSSLNVSNHTGMDALSIQTLRTKEGDIALLLVHKGESYTCKVPPGWGRGQAKIVVFLMRLTFHMCRTDTLETRDFESVQPSDIPLGWTADSAGMARHASMAPLARRSSLGLHADQTLLKKEDDMVHLTASLTMRKKGSQQRPNAPAPPKAAPGAIGVDTTAPGYEDAASQSIISSLVEAAFVGALAVGVATLFMRMRSR